MITSSRMADGMDYWMWGFHEVIHAQNQEVVRRAWQTVGMARSIISASSFSTFRVDLTVKSTIAQSGLSCRLTLWLQVGYPYTQVQVSMDVVPLHLPFDIGHHG